MKLKSQIPNLFTLSNLICGMLAIYATTVDSVPVAAYLILVAALFDFVDGLVARALNVAGELGKQLDSLADLVSFGVAPAFIALSIIGSLKMEMSFTMAFLLAFSPLIMGVFSAYRLAKFNIDIRQQDQFIGLPTPANALFWLSMPLIAMNLAPGHFLDDIYLAFLNSFWAVIIASVVLSFLLVSELPLISLKFKNLKFRENKYRFILLGSGLILLLIFWVKAVPIILILYIILSIIQTLTHKKHGI